MKRNVSTVLPLTPTQQPDSNLSAPPIPGTSPETSQVEPVLSNRAPANLLTSTAPQSKSSSIEIVRPTLMVVPQFKAPHSVSTYHSPPEKSYRSTSTSVVSDSATTDADAQFKLGMRYDKGKGVDVDKAKAFEWYQKAAKQGNEHAKYCLERLYK
ncbi:MAG: tetratricopeptide repeat protein [bacterium]|jgi:hypothetical protein